MNEQTLRAKILCFVGWHAWEQSRVLNAYDAFPAPFDSEYKNPERHCTRCGKEQRWLPGYGGSEFGCWIGR